uniref:Geranylgeranyl transferase type-2 subunit alpha n=1 Tax=Dugesia japonica TaxID=6161 RepID=A0A2U8U4E7_DUGJA|nr:GGT [Dugesia japonica]
MHGRLKVKTSEEQLRSKLIEKEAKVRLFGEIRNKIIDARKNNESSIEILNLMTECLLKAPEWNLFWNYRREILINLNFDNDLMNKDLSLTERCLRENPKAYAVWHHRSWILLNIDNPNWNNELELCNKALKLDERNFHCWDHRRFVVENGKIPHEKEFEYTEKQILDNISNYSSWHYRSSFLLNKSTTLNLENELDLINNAVFTDPLDQSPWFYLRWLMVYNRKKAFIRELYVNKLLREIVLIVSETVSSKFMDGVNIIIKTIDSISGEEFVYSNGGEGGIREGDKCNMIWKPVLSSDTSSVWLFSLEDIDLEKKLSITVTCESDPDFKWQCELDSKNQESLIRVDTDINRILCESVSEEMPLEVLNDELKIVKDLYEMEPNNKWVILTIISILRIIKPLESCDEISEKFEILKKIDPMRQQFYSEAWSRFRIECELISLYKNHKRAVVLADKNLTAISHLDWMTLMTDINFSRNQLNSIPEQFKYLVCVSKLDLSCNEIKSLKNLKPMKSLQHLNVQNNCIVNYEDLEPVFHCVNLISLNIKGNLVSQLPNLTELIAEHPSSKLHLKSISIIYDKNV